MEASQTALMLGEVQGALSALSKNMDRVLDNQETARVEVIAVADKLQTKLDQHSATDTDAFAAMKTHIGEGLGGLRDRIAQLEILPDRVESHGDAIATIEQRLTDADQVRKLLDMAHTTNQRWQKSIIGAAATLAGMVGATHGVTVFKWILTLIH